MAAKSLKEAAILAGALYAWCTVGGNICGYCIGTVISFAKPMHPIPTKSSYSRSNNYKMSMGDLRRSYVNKQLSIDDDRESDGNEWK